MKIFNPTPQVLILKPIFPFNVTKISDTPTIQSRDISYNYNKNFNPPVSTKNFLANAYHSVVVFGLQ